MTASRKPPRRSPRVSEKPAAPYNAPRVLLDTHVWLWWQAGDRRLGDKARAAIKNAPEVRFSVASAWEMTIKESLGKLKLPAHSSLVSELDRNGFQSLAIEIEHTATLRLLPPLHRDPFDRMLVAQAMTEQLTLITADDALMGYGVSVLNAAG